MTVAAPGDCQQRQPTALGQVDNIAGLRPAERIHVCLGIPPCHQLGRDVRQRERDPAGSALDVAQRYLGLELPLVCEFDVEGRTWRECNFVIATIQPGLREQIISTQGRADLEAHRAIDNLDATEMLDVLVSSCHRHFLVHDAEIGAVAGDLAATGDMRDLAAGIGIVLPT